MYSTADLLTILIFLQIFVESNQGSEDETRIDAIDILGTPTIVYVVCSIWNSDCADKRFISGTKDLSGLQQAEE